MIDIVPDFVDIVLENNGIRLCINGEIGQQYADIASIEQKERSLIGCHFSTGKCPKKVREKIKRRNVFLLYSLI